MPETRGMRRRSVIGRGADDLPTTGGGGGNGWNSSSSSGGGGGGGGGKPGNGYHHDGQQQQQQQEDSDAASAVQAKEAARSKIALRVLMGVVLAVVFFGVAWAGHIYIFLLICCIQIMLFKELVAVRYKAAMEKRAPLFRTLQWSWFTAAMIYAHGDSIVRTLREARMLDAADAGEEVPEKSLIYGSFSLFSALFVLSVLTLRPGLYKYQVGQLAWTIVILCIIVGQLKVVTPNIFSGVFWYFFPASCIMINDIMAYVCGMTLGRRVVKRPFLRLSPNKTWEGFIGAFLFTLLWAFWFSGFLSRFPYFTCSYTQLRPSDEFDLRELRPGSAFEQAWLHGDTLQPDSIFTQAWVKLPECLARLLRRETLPVKPIQLHGLVVGIFGSLVAPFGGFLMSAIKRAYGIKDFDSVIPGHGGVTDRMDCQLVMILFTFVHYQTFIRHAPLGYERVLSSILALKPEDQLRILEELQKLVGRHKGELAKAAKAAAAAAAAAAAVGGGGGGGLDAGLE